MRIRRTETECPSLSVDKRAFLDNVRSGIALAFFRNAFDIAGEIQALRFIDLAKKELGHQIGSVNVNYVGLPLLRCLQ